MISIIFKHHIWKNKAIIVLTIKREKLQPCQPWCYTSSKCWLWSLIFLIQRCYFSWVWILAPEEGVWGWFFPHYSHQVGSRGGNAPIAKISKKCLVKCCNFKVITWSIMGDLRAHGFGNPMVFSHGIPFRKGRHCNTTVYCIVAL